MAALFFAASMFASAALLFLVEPMVARMLLPLLGGSPAVWNTCMVFFQAALLAGYLYAHASTKWLERQTQIVVHIALIAAALLVLPLAIPQGTAPPAQASPVLWILRLLAVSIGLPFLALSAGTPILQNWFSQTTHGSARDPYFLYATSNAGSLVGLLGYPLLLEPWLRLGAQSRFWTAGYLGLLALTALCALFAWRSGASVESVPRTAESTPWKTRALWIALAFVPSSLMLGVTTALTTDVPAIPFLWVMPLALYLLSFVLVFTSKPVAPHAALVRRLPFLILLALIPTLTKTRLPIEILLVLYLMTLFAAAMVCHGELARGRPPATRLTEFYLWISIGGVLGGIFNSLIAPVVFRSVVEFPLALILAALLRPEARDKKDSARTKTLDWLFPAVLGLSMLAVIAFVRRQGIKPGLSANALIFGYSIFWCLNFSKRSLRFALGAAALVLATSTYTGSFGRILYTERSFFGVSRVTNDAANEYRSLFHGGTVHGIQSLDPARGREPLAYYTKSGPVGQVFDSGRAGAVAIVGLGAGAMACYMQPGQPLTYYEIDPSIGRIASDPNYFTFLSQCAPQANVVLGDARLSLRNAPDHEYGLIILDAFSGDSIPIHLLTREALRLYLMKLAPGGLLVFHISNRYLDLAPTLGAQARDAGLASLVRDDTAVPQAEIDRGKLASKWAVMARQAADFGGLASDARWTPIETEAGVRVWTDDYSNLLGIIRWR
ncbi:MAG TPA: fused MFS/spermidine synthase [Bryobacteraceae bacterium]|nr:fused MFS/spermidine synthase [Bryobacteraceae bacterium]